jgi:hypothetical protein
MDEYQVTVTAVFNIAGDLGIHEAASAACGQIRAALHPVLITDIHVHRCDAKPGLVDEFETTEKGPEGTVYLPETVRRWGDLPGTPSEGEI